MVKEFLFIPMCQCNLQEYSPEFGEISKKKMSDGSRNTVTLQRINSRYHEEFVDVMSWSYPTFIVCWEALGLGNNNDNNNNNHPHYLTKPLFPNTNRVRILFQVQRLQIKLYLFSWTFTLFRKNLKSLALYFNINHFPNDLYYGISVNDTCKKQLNL